MCKNLFSAYGKVPRSPTPSGRVSRTDDETKRKNVLWDESNVSISLLTEADSLFLVCQGLTLHYKICGSESEMAHSSSCSSSFSECSPHCSPRRASSGKLKLDRPTTAPSKNQHQHIPRSFSSQLHHSSLYAPLLVGSAPSGNLFPDEVSSSENNNQETYLEVDGEQGGRFGVVLVHGFGGGVFSWRHVMGPLARQMGCTVVAFDRPGWGLTSRPRRKDCEEKQLPNPYEMESQVIPALSFSYWIISCSMWTKQIIFFSLFVVFFFIAAIIFIILIIIISLLFLFVSNSLLLLLLLEKKILSSSIIVRITIIVIINNHHRNL